MTTSTLKATTIALMIGAALASRATTAEAQLGSVLRRVVPKPQGAAAPAPHTDAQPPSATGHVVKVKVSLHVTGGYQHSGPKTFPSGSSMLALKRTVDNSYTMEYVVAAEMLPPFAGLQKTNPLDPASQKEMDDYNAKARAREDRIYHSADDLRGKGPGAPAGMRRGANPVAMMDPALMQKIMACGQDQACKQRVAMEMMAQQQAQVAGPGAAVMADMQAISNRCVSKGNTMGSKGYEACMNAEGEKRSTVARSTADNEPEVAELPDRYLLYRGDCQQAKAHIKINESGILGVLDTGGYFEGNGTTVGEGDIDAKGMKECPGQVVFDTRTNVFWGGALVPLNLEGRLAQTGNREATGGGAISPEITEWVASSMRGASATGTRTRQFGYQTATVTWSYVKE